MQGALSPADRKLLSVCAVGATALAAAILLLSPVKRPDESPVPSTYSSSSDGARAAYLLLESLHCRVTRWEESPSRVPDSRDAVFVLADPSESPSPGEVASISKFVQDGGRVLFCGASIEKFFPSAAITIAKAVQPSKGFFAQLPSPYSRDARQIAMKPRAYWSTLSSSQLSLYGDSVGPVVVAWRIGSGEVLWWAAPTPLTNAGIQKEGNLALFLDAVSGAADHPTSIYWDEYFHGQRTSLWSYVERTPVKWALWQAALFAALVLFTFSRRWGPVIPLERVSRLSPLEFVDALGGLYQKAGATTVPISVAYRHLRSTLTRRLLLPGSIPDADLAKAAAERLGWDCDKITHMLGRASFASYDSMTPPLALGLLQELEECTMRLERPITPTDKN